MKPEQKIQKAGAELALRFEKEMSRIQSEYGLSTEQANQLFFLFVDFLKYASRKYLKELSKEISKSDVERGENGVSA